MRSLKTQIDSYPKIENLIEVECSGENCSTKVMVHKNARVIKVTCSDCYAAS